MNYYYMKEDSQSTKNTIIAQWMLPKCKPLTLLKKTTPPASPAHYQTPATYTPYNIVHTNLTWQ